MFPPVSLFVKAFLESGPLGLDEKNAPRQWDRLLHLRGPAIADGLSITWTADQSGNCIQPCVEERIDISSGAPPNGAALQGRE
jgi:hypothetical protein